MSAGYCHKVPFLYSTVIFIYSIHRISKLNVSFIATVPEERTVKKVNEIFLFKAENSRKQQ